MSDLEKTESEIVAFNKELEENGLVLVDLKDKELLKSGLSVEVDIDTEIDYSRVIGLLIKKLTKRKDFFYIHIKSYSKETKTLTFTVFSPMSKFDYEFLSEGKNNNNVIVGTTFPDFCWYHAEGTTSETILELDTKFRDSAIKGDLTNILPSRFADNFIEIMHTLNQSFIEGIMQEAIIYGPFF